MKMVYGEVDGLRRRLGELVAMARLDDLADRGDLTSELLIPEDREAAYRLVARQGGVLCGRLIAADILRAYDGAVGIDWSDGVDDGVRLDPGAELARIRGPARSVLAAERVLLNFLQRLCGVATATRTFVDAVAGTAARIYDTRKTTPGWRHLERYAVCCGGGHNHRMGLYEAVLIKDNHLAGIPTDRLAGAVFELMNRAAALQPPPAFVEIEVDTLQQLEQVFKVVGVELILLDNFTPADMRTAVELRDSLGLAGQVELEASGGVNLDTVRAIAETGVERIAIGALTHSATALDLALESV